LKRSREEAADRVYRRVRKLPREQRGAAVREMVNAIIEVTQVNHVVRRETTDG
jgi:hypothetical protein